MPNTTFNGNRAQRRRDERDERGEYFSLVEYTANLDEFTLAARIDAEQSLYRWCEVVLGYAYLPTDCDYRLWEPAHRPMCDNIESAMPIRGRETRGYQDKKLRLEPRGSLKTNLIAIGSLLYYLVFNYDGRELISSHNQKAAKEILKAVKWNLEFNKRFKDFYGDWSYYAKKYGVWRDDYIELAFRTKAFREPTIDTAGAEMSKTGGHYDWMVVDDIVNRENVRSKTERDNVRERFQEYIPQIDTNGGLCVIGTRYHRSDLYGWIMKRRELAIKKIASKNLTEEDSATERGWLFEITVKSAWNPDGSLYYPTRLTAQFLAQQQLELEDYLFAVWYRNEPIDDTAKIFVNPQARERDFEYVPGDIPFIELPNGERRSVFPTMAWDPKGRETTSKKSDAHGFSIIGTDSIDVWWVLRAMEMRLPLDELLESICIHVLRYGVQILSIETRGGHAQGLYIDLLRPVLDRFGLSWLEIYEWSPGTTESKDALIRSHQPRFKRGGMWFKRGECDVLIQQMDDFPQLENDDVLDTLAQQKTVARPAEPAEMYAAGAAEGDFDRPEGMDEPLSTGAWAGLGTPDYHIDRTVGGNYGQRNHPNEGKKSRDAGDQRRHASGLDADRGWRPNAGSAANYEARRPNA